ncbi:MAG: aspartate aminotransferase [Bacteroidetes bacterium 43-93]|nr:pyridoxal phosphate-dependent aminotransferase [Bacteroidota bacterium]OJX01041.1 MAG: aspartate aminotransferase [Bacteroidetes bacterium 43-93]
MQLAQRLNRIAEPQTIKMAKLSRELRAKGIDIIDLSLGEPDFATPEFIDDAATLAMEQGYTKYPPVAGYPELREAISKKLKRDNDLEYSADEIIVSTGAKQSLANAILSIINPGDEVIIPTPYWVTYGALVSLAEGINKFLPCTIDTDFKLTAERLEQAITPKTRLFIFSSPCNPTGSVYSKDELAALAEVFNRHPQVAIISDEIYEYINYNGKHESIGQFTELRDRVIIVNGLSKGFAMTGWRLGYLAGPKELVQACEKFQGQFTSGANSITQRAAITALTSSLEETYKMRDAFRERRDYVIEALRAMPGISINVPEGAFYAFPNVSSFFGKSDGATIIKNDEDFSMYLMYNAHISTVNGGAFGNDNCIRLSFATSMDKLRIAMERMATALSKLK